MKPAYLRAAVLLMSTAVCLADWKADVGYTSLKARLGATLPTGAGIEVTHVEAPSGGNYQPDSTNAQFAGKTIVAVSGASGVSSHATTVGQYYYGLTSSIAPGVTSIFAYQASNWIGSGQLWLLNTWEPGVEIARVQNHSWIGTVGSDDFDADALRRLDLVIERDGVVVAAGVNNGAGSAIPHLLGSAYNVLSVGLTNGNSSYGPTGVEVAGRVKPNLVAPASQTSYATPMVASAATILTQGVDAAGLFTELPVAQQRPAKALLVRTLLMAGATKSEFADWRRGFSAPTTDGSVPLDYRYGAGELNIDNSFRILEAGRQSGGAGADLTLTGWDFSPVTPGSTRRYFFEIPPYSYATTVSVLVAWNRHITPVLDFDLLLIPSLANIDLRLRAADGSTPGAVRDQSVSRVDNVEHIFLRGLGSGRYAFEVETDIAWDYALGWDLQLAPTAPLDFDGDGDIDKADLAIIEACQTGPAVPYVPTALPVGCKLSPSTDNLIPADLDRDGDVDQADFGRFQTCVGASQVVPPASCFTP